MIDHSDYRIDVFPEYHNNVLIAYISHFPPLDLYTQGGSPEEAEEGMRSMIKSWAMIASERLRVEMTSPKHYGTGVTATVTP